MAESRTTTKSRKPPPVKLDQPTIARALRELDVTVPYYNARLVGNRIEFHLYGGAVVYWPDPPPNQKKVAP
jgi:hypothetical protein